MKLPWKKNVEQASKLDSIIKEAQKKDSYFITVTIKDGSKTENDLTHYVFQREFPKDDIISSLDQCIKSLRIKSEESINKIQATEVKALKELAENQKKN